MNEQDLRRLLGVRKTGKGKRGWRCPDDADLAAYVDAHLADDARQRIEAHLSDCDFCLEQVAFLVRPQESAMPEVPAGLLARARELAPARAEATWWAQWRWGTAAAAAACAVFVAVVWWRQPSPPSVPSGSGPAPAVEVAPAPGADTVPAAPPRVVRNGEKSSVPLRLLLPREGAVIARESCDFRWTQVRGSLFYEVRLMTGDGDLVWEGRVEGTQVRIPATVQLVPGGKYFVSVRAHLPEGKALPAAVAGFTVAESR